MRSEIMLFLDSLWGLPDILVWLLLLDVINLETITELSTCYMYNTQKYAE